MKNKILLGDCLELMQSIPSGSIDMILCDLPYGTTACKWDTIIPFDTLWEQYERVTKSNGAIVLFGSEPFSSHLRLSKIDLYRYDFKWLKSRTTGFQTAKKRPMKDYEDIMLFYSKQPTYHNTQLRKLDKPLKSFRKNGKGGSLLNTVSNDKDRVQECTGFNRQTLSFNNEHNVGAHPTQKPVKLFEYLIKTYTNENGLVLDNCSGSGTTAIACINTDRNYICMEKDETYFLKSQERVQKHLEDLFL